MALIVSATGSAPVPTVWNLYTTPQLWPTWAPQIHRVDYPGHAITPGTSGRIRGTARVRLDFTIDDVDAKARCWSWSVWIPSPIDAAGFRLRVAMDHGVEPAGAGSRAWVRLHLPTPVALVYVPVARLALRRLVAEPLR